MHSLKTSIRTAVHRLGFDVVRRPDPFLAPIYEALGRATQAADIDGILVVDSKLRVFGADSEVDVVNEQILGGGQNGADTVRFAADVAAADLSAERNYVSLTLRVDSTGAELLLQGWFIEPGGTVESFEFADGITWAAADVEAGEEADVVQRLRLQMHPRTASQRQLRLLPQAFPLLREVPGLLAMLPPVRPVAVVEATCCRVRLDLAAHHRAVASRTGPVTARSHRAS